MPDLERDRELILEFPQEEPPVETHVAHGWTGLGVQFSRLKLPAEYAFSWQGGTHYLAYHDLLLLDGEMEVTGERPVAGGDLRDQMTFVPSGQPLSGWAKPADRMNAFTVLTFDTVHMEEEVQAHFRRQELRPHIYFRDDILGSTMRKLGHLMSGNGATPTKAYLEAVSLTAALEAAHHVFGQAQSLRAPGELTHRQKCLLMAYIEANISRDIGLEELATVCGMTRFHFSRAFKRTFGEPPYRYLTRWRLDMAKRLLADTALPVAEVGYSCGFNGASQFTRAFREVQGMSPLEFRRSLR